MSHDSWRYTSIPAYEAELQVRPRRASRSEDTVPTGARWWVERTERWAVESSRGLSPATAENRRLALRRFPAIFARLGFPGVSNAGAVTAEMVAAYKAEGRYTSGTLTQQLRDLRSFLRWEGSKLAEEPGLWATPNVVAVNRRWLTRPQLAGLLDVARQSPKERERVAVFLAGANGLRLGEVTRLKVSGCQMDLAGPTLTVLGKGRNGGKWRTVGMNPLVWDVLLPVVKGKRPSDRVYPFASRTADMDIRNVGRRAGLPSVSAHDLRRTFGRLYYKDTHDLVGLQHLYGHRSVEMTAYYIGLDLTQMASGLQAFAESMRKAMLAVGSD